MSEENTGVANALVDAIRSNAGMAIAFGVIMLIAGIAALAAPAVAALSVTIMVGITLAVSGVCQCVLAFKAGAFGQGLMVFLIGAMMAVAGFYMIGQPVAGVASLTILLMAYLIATGIMEIVVAFQLKPAAGWGLQLTNGILTLLLGILLWQQFPVSGIWAIGVLFGIKMLFSGIALITIARGVREAVPASD